MEEGNQTYRIRVPINYYYVYVHLFTEIVLIIHSLN